MCQVSISYSKQEAQRLSSEPVRDYGTNVMEHLLLNHLYNTAVILDQNIKLNDLHQHPLWYYYSAKYH